MDFLSEKGLLIFKELKKHCEKQLKMMEVDEYELKMLASSFDRYAKNAKFCRDNGDTFDMPTKTGVYPMIRPEYNVMKNEYSQILTHAGKFGLNPGDREKLFKKLKTEETKKKAFDTGMKIAK